MTLDVSPSNHSDSLALSLIPAAVRSSLWPC
jgi:hypothetical protein